MSTDIYRFKVGTFECMAVSDGTHTYAPPMFPPPTTLLFTNAPKEQLEQEPPPPMTFPVVGVAPGIIGCIQATEVIKYIVGIGDLLKNRLLLFDGLVSSFREVVLRRNPNCRDCSVL